MFLRRASSILPRIILSALLLTLAACGKDSTSPSGYACSGGPAQCLRLNSGWTFEAMTITNPAIGDVTVVRLADGRYRIYGGENIDPAANQRVYHSYISSNGVSFAEEAGYRLTGKGIHAGYVVGARGGGFRMYWGDQSTGLISDRGSPTILSAYSRDGMTFTIETGARLTALRSGYETDGIADGRPVMLPDSTLRMYYHGKANGKDYLLSATSPDGLTWTRDPGVRLQSSTLCPPEEGVARVSPVFDRQGRLHLLVTATLCQGDYVNPKAGIWDATSSDGLTFTFPDRPIVEGYFRKETYTGNPGDPGVNPQDPTAVRTDDGLRVFFGLYWGPTIIPESGIYSMSLRQ